MQREKEAQKCPKACKKFCEIEKIAKKSLEKTKKCLKMYIVKR